MSTRSQQRVLSLAFLLLVAMLWSSPHAALAQGQPRDYMLEFQPEGTFFMLDYFGTGAMLTLEHRERIYGAANDLTLGTTVIPSYPLGELNVRADLRILFLSIGGTLAYRSVWRSLAFESGEDSYCVACERGDRRDIDPVFGDTPGTDTFGFAEARATLYFPFNEHIVGLSTASVRYEDRQDRTYDWYFTSIYDRGVIGRWEAMLFLKHHDWGGIGPYLQYLSLPRDGEHRDQWAYGFNAVTRLGLMRRDDLLFITFLIRPGDKTYGQHSYHAPVRSLIIYRMAFEL